MYNQHYLQSYPLNNIHIAQYMLSFLRATLRNMRYIVLLMGIYLLLFLLTVIFYALIISKNINGGINLCGLQINGKIMK